MAGTDPHCDGAGVHHLRGRHAFQADCSTVVSVPGDHLERGDCGGDVAVCQGRASSLAEPADATGWRSCYTGTSDRAFGCADIDGDLCVGGGVDVVQETVKAPNLSQLILLLLGCLERAGMIVT